MVQRRLYALRIWRDFRHRAYWPGYPCALVDDGALCRLRPCLPAQRLALYRRAPWPYLARRGHRRAGALGSHHWGGPARAGPSLSPDWGGRAYGRLTRVAAYSRHGCTSPTGEPFVAGRR